MVAIQKKIGKRLIFLPAELYKIRMKASLM